MNKPKKLPHRGKPKTELSQNYLKNPGLIRRLIKQIDLDKSIPVLEIGGGLGIITQMLLETGFTTTVIEKDQSNYQQLFDRFGANENATVIHGDALNFQIEIGNFKSKNEPKNSLNDYQIFSNPPFSISSKLIKHFLLKPPFPSKAGLILQKKASERYLGVGRHSLVSRLLSVVYDSEIIFNFHSSDFTPPPYVAVSMVKFTRKSDLDPVITENFDQFVDFVSHGFTQPIKPISEKFSKYKPTNNRKDRLNIHKSTPLDLSQEQWVWFYKDYFKYK